MKIAILGLGVVGRGVFDILQRNSNDIEIKYILEIDKNKTCGLEKYLVKSIDEILQDKEVEVVIELIGGKKIAYNYVTKAIKAGKHVVTANKALISEFYEELRHLSSRHNVQLLYEASVGGGIIIIDVIKNLNTIDNFIRIEGILNGSSNYVLSKIFNDNKTKDDSIKEATELGYLEKNSNDDLLGLDSIRKINILSMIAYRKYIDESSIIYESVDKLTELFINYVKEKKLIIKYLATSELIDDKVSIHLEPVILDKRTMISNIDNEYNIINLYSEYHHKQTFIGQGAGRYPTATAIIYDLKNVLLTNKSDTNIIKKAVVDNTSKKYSFLVQSKDEIHIIDSTSLVDIKDIEDIVCYARIDVEAYEKL
ncbi:MAG: homoserine dehydrogenase [Candidatus Izemoplasmatales bacterium]|jgi:homoserine dehydrogenase|nr:homoserine dehydrogenase [Candidatus Izemoplasmatales bacterium]